MKLKIGIVVHGRFHAFDVARELLRRGHDVTLLTNHPPWSAERFGIPRQCVLSAWPQGVADRLTQKLSSEKLCIWPEAWLHRWFGRWAASRIVKECWDAVVCWSGVGEETFLTLSGKGVLRICNRGSSHIRTQARLLQEESLRVGVSCECPSPWMIAREEREYALADVLCVPSTFAKQTCIQEGVVPDKVALVLLGVDTRAFRPSLDVIESRCARIISGEPLRVLGVGTISFRKGVWDLAEILKVLRSEPFSFRFVGPIESQAAPVVSRLRDYATFLPAQPQKDLPSHYAWGDVFLLPTIEDGFQLVLGQAAAAGLPILTTSHGAGLDLVHEGMTGWVLPVRNPGDFVQRLRWCHEHRRELAEVVRNTYEAYRPRDWADVAKDFEALVLESRPLLRKIG